MDTCNNQEKGDSLENAVKLIIEAVLESDPKFKGQKFTIATKVRDMSSGVPNEIDVLVTSSPGTDYASKFIFECKNWKAPVGKDVIQLVSKVVEEVGATRGFVVARSITKYARDQIEKEPRVRFVRCSDDFLSPFSSAELIHTELDTFPPRVIVKWRTFSSGDTSLKFDPITTVCHLDSLPVNFLMYVHSQLAETTVEARKQNPSKFNNQGTHWIMLKQEIRYAEKEFQIHGLDVETLTIPFHAFVKCQRRKLVSKFELEDRGQAFTFEPIDTGDPEKPLEVQIITRFKQGVE